MTATNKSMAAARTFGEAIEPFIDAGIPEKALLPIVPHDARVAEGSKFARTGKGLGKAPGRYDAFHEEWGGQSGDHLTRGLPEDVRKRARNWPTGSVGVLGRVLPGIDVDAGSEDFLKIANTAFVETLGNGGGYAERLRGDSWSRLYTFACTGFQDPDRCVRSRHLKCRMKGDDVTKPAKHGVDILGYEKQYLIAGIHANGRDEYHWHQDRDLAEIHRGGRLSPITDGDVDRFLKRLRELIEADGGEVFASDSTSTSSGQLHDYRDKAPIVEPGRIIDALNGMSNTETNFPGRNDLVGILSAIYAAAGRYAEDPGFEEQVREWAVDSSEGYCDDDYFDDAWNSLRKGVKCGRDRLLVHLRQHGVRDLDGIEFQDDAAALSPVIREHKAAEKAAKAAKNAPLLARAMEAYAFQHMGTATGAASRNIRQPMRLRAHPERVWSATDWWAKLTPDPDPQLLLELHAVYGEKKTGLPDFLRDLQRAYPFAFFAREIRDPKLKYGEVAEQYDTSGNPDGALNVRQRSQAQNAADKTRRNPALARQDRDHFLDFFRRGFGDGQAAEWLLNTLAYMVQTGKRPGHMLVIEGEPEVGKSLFVEMLIALFDGTGPHVRGRIDGAKLMNEAALRFLFGQIEGSRIVSIKELPEGSGREKTAALISTVKQMVDAGSGGEYIDVERKGVDSRSIENHGYIIATTNYENVIPIEEGDRRIMPVRFRITQANRPDQVFYARLGAILADPERLAAIWDYLALHDIRGYRADAPPPVTSEKASAQYLNMMPAVRHMAVAIDTLIHNGRLVVTLADIVSAMNWSARFDDGDWDGGGDLYRAGNPVGVNDRTGGPGPVLRKALDYLGDKARKRETKVGRGRDQKRAPTVYALKGCTVPIEDMQWAELSELLERDRARHPVREGVRAKPYDVRIEGMAPVSDRLAGEDEDSADGAGRGNVVPMNARRRA